MSSAGATSGSSSSAAGPSTQSHARSPIPRYIDNGHIELVSVIGTGAYGQVYSAWDYRYTDSEGQPLPRAVKCLRRHGLDARQRQFQRREIGLHRLATGHPSIIGMSRMLEEGDWIFMVMEYAPEGDLFGMICDKQRYVGDDELIRSIFLQLIDGLAFLHNSGISHRDIKPENLVCSDNGTRVRICDFGLATSERKSNEFGCGSTFYIAPECLGDWNPQQTHYDTQRSDIWSLGVILVNLVCGRNPWRIASTSDDSFTAYLADPTFLRRILPISDDCLYLLSRIFTLDADSRVTLAELRRDVLAVKTFHMTEDELRAAHVAAQQQQVPTVVVAAPTPACVPVADKVVKAKCNMDMDLDDDEDDQWLEHADEYDDEQVFHFDEELQDEDVSSLETPSLRADSDSPSPPHLRSRSGSSSGGCSIPGTPECLVEATVPTVNPKLFFPDLATFSGCSSKASSTANLYPVSARRSLV